MAGRNQWRCQYALLSGAHHMDGVFPEGRWNVVHFAKHGRENQTGGSRVMDFNKDIIDAASMALVIGTLAEWLPPVAAAISIVWTCLRIYGWWKDR